MIAVDCKLPSKAETAMFVEMEDAFNQLEHLPLREVLLDSLKAESDSVRAISDSFVHFLEGEHPTEVRRTFFASWQRTNNSAMSVEGLANRITKQAEEASKADASRALAMFRSAGRLNRVADEDLGVGGQVQHFELYYRMATEFTDRDDRWQSRKYCLNSAKEFKSWLDLSRLRDPIMTGLFSLLVHEGYTHAELEMIAPLFHTWARDVMKIPPNEVRKVLAWITVHNGGTEKAHFAHSCAALAHYCEGSGSDVDLAAAGDIFRSYLRRKAAVMRELDELY